MKTMKRILCLVMALMLVAALGATALAEETTYSITIKNPTMDVTYSVYKIFDATYSGSSVSYKASSGKDYASLATYFTVDSNGYVTVNPAAKDGSGALNDNAVTALGTWLGSTPAVQSVKATDSSITAGKLTITLTKPGYYYVKGSQTNAVVSVDTAAPTVTIEDKTPNQPGPGPDPDGGDPNGYKFVKSAATTNYTSSANAAYGEKVTFALTFTAVNYVVKDKAATQVTSYTINDYPANLKGVTVKSVTVGGTPLETSAYTVSGNDSLLTVTIPWATEDAAKTPLYASPAVVVVEVEGTVNNANGDANNVVAANSVEMKWNNTPFKEKPETPDVTVKSYSLTVNTHKESAIGAAIDGATYSITGDYVKVGDYYRPFITDVDNASTKVSIGTMPGTFVIKGLNSNLGNVTMTSAPAGYNIAGNNSQAADCTGKNVTLDFVVTEGIQLPTTGGMGTTLFYVLGTVMVLGAVVLFVTKKRVDSKG